MGLIGQVDHGSATASGARSDNQDRCATTPRWAVLSDGMGGYAGGAWAAELTVDTVVRQLSVARRLDPAAVRAALRQANRAVRRARRADPTVGQMGATVTLAVVRRVAAAAVQCLVASVGDSPAWLVGATGARRLTVSHTLAEELVRVGAIPIEAVATHPGRNSLLRAVGPDEDVHPDLVELTLRPGEWLVLASDGLVEVLDDEAVHELVRDCSSATDAAQQLVAAALLRHVADNVTVAVLRLQRAQRVGRPDRR
jgi:serine/threonine protein phosphatase PrpC